VWRFGVAARSRKYVGEKHVACPRFWVLSSIEGAETMNQLMRTTPEEMGLHSQNILNLLERLEKREHQRCQHDAAAP